MKFLIILLAIIISLTALCSCNGEAGLQGPEGPQGPQGIQGEQGPAGKDGASFLTGKGEPSNELGKIGDSYLDLSGGEWGFYVKGENGWKLMGYIEMDPPPLTISDLNGSYALSHVVSGTNVYNIGDTYAGFTLSADMIQVELNEGVGNLAVNFGFLQETNITCTIEYEKLIMICENAINITGQPSSVYELSINQDGEIYVILEAYGDLYYVKKLNNNGNSSNNENNGSSENKDVDVILHTSEGGYSIKEDTDLCSNDIWEPNRTVVLYLSVKNNRSTDINYMISLEATDIVRNLNEVISYIIIPDATVDTPDSLGSLDWSAGKNIASGSNVIADKITLAPGAEHFFALVLHMDMSAGNEYMGGNITFNIKLTKENPS